MNSFLCVIFERCYWWIGSGSNRTESWTRWNCHVDFRQSEVCYSGRYEHYLSSSENKALKSLAGIGFEPMTSAIPVQCSTNWANEPTRTDHFFSPSLSYDMSVVDVQKLYCLHYSFSCSCVRSVLYQLRLTFSQNWLVNGTKTRQNFPSAHV